MGVYLGDTTIVNGGGGGGGGKPDDILFFEYTRKCSSCYYICYCYLCSGYNRCVGSSTYGCFTSDNNKSFLAIPLHYCSTCSDLGVIVGGIYGSPSSLCVSCNYPNTLNFENRTCRHPIIIDMCGGNCNKYLKWKTGTVCGTVCGRLNIYYLE